MDLRPKREGKRQKSKVKNGSCEALIFTFAFCLLKFAFCLPRRGLVFLRLRALDRDGRRLRDVVADALLAEACGEGRLGGDVDARVVG